MTSENVHVFPRIAEVRWWAIRTNFKRAMPSKLTTAIVETWLNIQGSSVATLLKALRDIGLIDEAGVPTDLAYDWRDDPKYAAACAAMLKAVYPQELLDAVPPATATRDEAQVWFQRYLKTGAENARQLATTYVLVANADLTAASTERPNSEGKPKAAKSTNTRTLRSKPEAKSETTKEKVQEVASRLAPPMPQIAVQVNIDPSMTPEQIEQVFESMARHFYKV